MLYYHKLHHPNPCLGKYQNDEDPDLINSPIHSNQTYSPINAYIPSPVVHEELSSLENIFPIKKQSNTNTENLIWIKNQSLNSIYSEQTSNADDKNGLNLYINKENCELCQTLKFKLSNSVQSCKECELISACHMEQIPGYCCICDQVS